METLSRKQANVLSKLKQGAAIGEFSAKMNGSYELFIPSENPTPRQPFDVARLNKNTVFALLTLGHIEQDDSTWEKMLPYSRDHWYVFREVNRS